MIDGFHRQFDFAAICEAEQFDLHDVALFDVVGWLAVAVVRHFGDVNEAVFRAEEVYERAELHDLHDFAVVDLAHFRLCRDVHDHLFGFFDLLGIRRGNLDDALVVDVDLRARLFDDTANDLAARSDDFADFVGVDLHGLDARGVLGEFLTARAERLAHFGEDRVAALMRL